MITKFLYVLNNKNKKIIVAVVEKGDDSFNRVDNKIIIEDIETFRPKPDETVTYNNGEHYYCQLKYADQAPKYLNVNMYRNDIFVDAKDIMYASHGSKEFISVILDNFEYFQSDNIKYFDSGISQNKRGIVTDNLEKTFRKVRDDSYIQFLNPVEYVGMVDGAYDIVESFRDAVKVPSRSIRQILIMDLDIDLSLIANKDLIAISPYNCFSNKEDLMYIGDITFKVSFAEDVLTISKDAEYSEDFRIINHEAYAENLKKIEKALTLEDNNNKSYVEINGKYLSLIDSSFMLVDNPSDATLISDCDLEVAKEGYAIYYETLDVKKYFGHVNFLYETDKGIFTISSEKIENTISGRILDTSKVERFHEVFAPGSLLNKNNGCLVMSNNKYLRMNVVSENQFIMIWLDSAFDATIFNEDQANLVRDIFGINVKKKDIINTLNPASQKEMNISNSKSSVDLLKEYQLILNQIKNSKHRVSSYKSIKDVKVETEKGSLEYLRYFYFKDVLDAKNVYERVFAMDKKVSKILIIGNDCNLNLIGLNLAYKVEMGEIEISTANTSKWGYLPHVKLNPNIKYVANYRLDFSDLSSTLLSQYDMILFDKGFNQTIHDSLGMFKSLENLRANILLVNVSRYGILGSFDAFHAFFNHEIKVKRVFIKNDYSDYVIAKDHHDHLISDMYRNGMLDDSKKEICFDDKQSYHSIVIKEMNHLKDYYKN